MITTTTNEISRDEADAIILDSVYGDMVEDGERVAEGWAYTLDNGTTVVVTDDGDVLESSEEIEDEIAQGERCPGCGCEPGDGLTEGCAHPEGCGFFRELEG